jgi:type II secretory pathway pseudopilin PulG
LIELMVVFGIIIIVFTTFGVAMRPSGGKSVRLAQNTVAGLYTVARLQAKTTQGNGRRTDSDAARIIIYASKQDDNDLARYLRQIQVVVPDPTDPNNKWMTVGEIVTLPAGVYVIPPGSNPQMATPGTWPGGTGRASKFTSMKPVGSTPNNTSETQPQDMAVDGQSAKKFYFTRITARGTLPTEGWFGDRLVLTEGRPRREGDTGQDPVFFTNAHNVRGFSIAQYGGVTLLNDVQDFPP